MRIYSEARLSPTAQTEPPLDIGSVLIPRGSSIGGMVTNGLLNRVGSYWNLETGKIRPRAEWTLREANLSMPPRKAALDAVVWLTRNPEAVDIPKASHLFIDLEGHIGAGGDPDNDARESLAAAYYLRARLPKTYLVSTYSRWQGGGDRLRVWAEADDAVVYSLYASNRSLMASDPVAEWVRTVDEAEDELEAVAPGKARVAFISFRYEVWWQDDPRYSALVPLHNTPIPVPFVRAMKARLQKPPRRNGREYRPWDICAYGPYSPDVAPHMDVILPPKVIREVGAGEA